MKHQWLHSTLKNVVNNKAPKPSVVWGGSTETTWLEVQQKHPKPEYTNAQNWVKLQLLLKAKYLDFVYKAQVYLRRKLSFTQVTSCQLTCVDFYLTHIHQFSFLLLTQSCGSGSSISSWDRAAKTPVCWDSSSYSGTWWGYGAHMLPLLLCASRTRWVSNLLLFVMSKHNGGSNHPAKQGFIHVEWIYL